MKYLLPIFALTVVAACVPEQRSINATADTNYQALDQNFNQDATFDPNAPVATSSGSIAADPNRIVLSDYTQEQQKIDREKYAAEQAAIAAGRTSVDASQVVVPTVSSVNVAAYARSSTNSIGQKVFNRSGKRGRCNYPTPADAQRAFLTAGGPTTDTLGLDSDGDGFACKFDPAPYRALM